MKRELSYFTLFLVFSLLSMTTTAMAKVAVGTPQCEFSVSPMGGASYAIKIDCPKGVAAMQPNIALSYNSQDGLGTAGYGFNITGFSTITCGVKDLYHDKTVAGAQHHFKDALFLDGKRMLLKSGEEGTGGVTYTVEGDPFTKITGYRSGKHMWFEVKTKDGKTYEYKEDFGMPSMHGAKWGFAAWYLTRQQDVLGNYISYFYRRDGQTLYLQKVTYGSNASHATDKLSFIDFEYDKIQKPFFYTFENHTCCIDLQLKSITTGTGSDIFRTYELEYDSVGDMSLTHFSRLVKVTEKNGNGEKMNPVTIDWQHLPDGEQERSTVDINLEDFSYIKKQDQNFLSADLNGDGINDIIRISNVYIDPSGNNNGVGDTFIYIYQSYKSADGKIKFSSPYRYRCEQQIDDKRYKDILQSCDAIDLDGDGLNDLVFPYFYKINDTGIHFLRIYVIYGKDVKQYGSPGIETAPFLLIKPLTSATDMPCFTTGDFNKDGKDEIFYIEDKAVNGKYAAGLVGYSKDNGQSHEKYSLPLLQAPKRVFSGDFNNDGLADIIVFYDKGYTIFYNDGGTGNFFGASSYSDTSLGYNWRMEQGDFNGDGLVDFVYTAEQSWDYYFALNEGNGKFSVSKAWTTYMPEQSTNKDNARNNLIVYDIDRDGKSDVVVLKAQYVHHGGLNGRNDFNYTGICWLRSDGQKLVEYKRTVSPREDDALSGSFLLGDFTGTGGVDLMGYGCDWFANGTAENKPEMRLYHTKGADARTSKAYHFVDGLRRETTVFYSTLADPNVYTHEYNSQYPVADIHAPVSVVKKVNTSNGDVRNLLTDYKYQGLKIHQTGKGLLGFMQTAVSDSVLKTKTICKVTRWDGIWFVPTETQTIDSLGTAGAMTTGAVSVVTTGDGNYFTYLRSKTSTDYDGNVKRGEYRYDAQGDLLSEKEVYDNDDSFFRETSYDEYAEKSGRRLPSLITKSQKHRDDSKTFVQKTRIEYDGKGLATKTIENDGTPLELTTVKTYDVWGNLLSSISTGKDVTPVTHYNEYDETGRFVVKAYQDPAAAVNTYTYDTWGNVLTETDESDPSNPQIVSHGYDNWGKLSSTTYPTGEDVSIQWGWPSLSEYSIAEKATGKPERKTVYDNMGRKMSVETVGPQNEKYNKVFAYDEMGNLKSEKTTYGNAISIISYTRDGWGRIKRHLVASHSDRRWRHGVVTYEYGNRSVTTNEGGRKRTHTYDAWGNLKTMTDSLTTTQYSYNSNGKPSEVVCCGSTVKMEYDEAGNQTKMDDPDAGTTSFEYSADGKLLRQTDANGVVTENRYDALGRLKSTSVGSHIVNNEYGTSGNGTLRLAKTTMDGNATSYGYDNRGRIVSENRELADGTHLDYTYTYDGKNLLTDVSYPHGVAVHYDYDDNGYRIGATYGDTPLYKLDSFFGSVSSYTLGNKIRREAMTDLLGYTYTINTVADKDTIQSLENVYDLQTGDLLSRRIDGQSQTFNYDGMDRLLSANTDGGQSQKMEYADNGNILSKSGIGGYTYNEGFKPHAVLEVENNGNHISSTLSTEYNDFNKIQLIRDENNGKSMSFSYGPDFNRWESVLAQNGKEIRKTVYGDEYECVTENGVTRHFYNIDGLAIVMKEEGQSDRIFYPCTDNQGNILKIVDQDGGIAFEATYDAWGNQTVKVNTIGYHRGYTGHEMLPEFDLINMNGRLYDPLLGRFLSPDHYIQSPDNSQNFNRYSYCLNNPLKYTDPSGEVFGIDDFLFFSIASGMMMGAVTAKMNGGSMLKGAIIGGLSSAIPYGIGTAFGHTVGSIGTELLRAGSHGLANGLMSLAGGGGFGQGLASGLLSSLAGSSIQNLHLGELGTIGATTLAGGLTSDFLGGDFLSGAISGMNLGMFNHGWIKNEQGENVYMLDDVFVDGRLSSFTRMTLKIASYLSPVGNFTNTGKEITKFSAIGSNKHLYFENLSTNQRFNGNQYVSIQKTTKALKAFKHSNFAISAILDGTEIVEGINEDSNGSQGNLERHLMHIGLTEAYSSIGSYYGARIGTAMGAGIGGYFSLGFASIPLATAGAISGTLLGGYLGNLSGELIYHVLYY